MSAEPAKSRSSRSSSSSSKRETLGDASTSEKLGCKRETDAASMSAKLECTPLPAASKISARRNSVDRDKSRRCQSGRRRDGAGADRGEAELDHQFL